MDGEGGKVDRPGLKVVDRARAHARGAGLCIEILEIMRRRLVEDRNDKKRPLLGRERRVNYED